MQLEREKNEDGIEYNLHKLLTLHCMIQTCQM